MSIPAPPPAPDQPKIYHIVHEDRLASIVKDGFLWCDAIMVERDKTPSATIGMERIKQRRREELNLASHPELYVGDCVPFSFCPRSVMLYMICMRNPDLTYHGGQEPIVHLEVDVKATVAWADTNGLRWAFTLSNAGSYYFADYADLKDLDRINWAVVQSKYWQGYRKFKQAEFLVESKFSWELVERAGVKSTKTQAKVLTSIQQAAHRPPVEHIPCWYY